MIDLLTTLCHKYMQKCDVGLPHPTILNFVDLVMGIYGSDVFWSWKKTYLPLFLKFEIHLFLTLSAFGLVKSIRSFASSNHRIIGFPAFFIIFCQDQANFFWLWYDSFCYFYWLFTRFSSLKFFLFFGKKFFCLIFPCHSSFVHFVYFRKC